MVPLIVFSAIGLSMLLEAERQAALTGVREALRATALLVDQELSNAQATLRVLGTSESLKNGDVESFYHRAKVASENPDTWVVLFDRDGRQLVNTLVPFGTPLPRRQNPENGLEIMRTQKPRVTDLVNGPVRKNWLVALDVPVPLEEGQRYILSQGFVPDYFNRVLQQHTVPPSWIIGIIDRKGITIARSRNAAQYIGKETVPALSSEKRKASEGILRTTSLDGVDIYAVFTTSALSGWTVAIGVPRAEIEKTARQAVLVTALGLLIALVCAAAAAIVFGRRLAKSILVAERSALALGRGMKPQPKQTGVAEVDRLHGALAEAGAMLDQERTSRQLVEAERTRLLVSEQEARRLADAQNKSKDEFLAMLGHELRNPLAAIAGAFSVMEAPAARPEQIARAQVIGKRQVNHLSRIVDDLLDVGRIMAGKVLLKKQTLNLAEMVRRCVDSCRTLHDQRHEWDVQVEDVWIDADPTRLQQVIGNLLTNAQKYTPGGGRITVLVRGEGPDAVVEVHDTGIGIEPDLLPRIFDAFVQGPTSIDRAQGGLGLGLPLVRQLMALHGGSVTADSAGPGMGSTFKLRLPRVPAPEQFAQTEGLAIPGSQAKRVLIVEDNDDGRNMLATALQLKGFKVRSCGNGLEALEHVAAELPDIAIIDIGLPGISGYEIAERLHADPATTRIRLIALTGYGLEQDRQRAMAAGFMMHLTKPYVMEQLLDTIASVSAAGT